MSPDQEVQTSNRSINVSSGGIENDQIAALISALSSKGESLIRNVPSSFDNHFFIELEHMINRLYNALDKVLDDDASSKDKGVIKKMMVNIEKNILPSVSAWSDFAKKNPKSSRSENLFRSVKPIGRKLRELKDKFFL